MTTAEKNQLIAEFMGYENWPEYKSVRLKRKDGIDAYTHICEYKNLQYHKSWDCLMPVVDKIEALLDGGIEVGIHFGSTIISKCRNIETRQLNNPETLFEITMSEGYDFEHKIGYTYEAVLQFIAWYDQNDAVQNY